MYRKYTIIKSLDYVIYFCLYQKATNFISIVYYPVMKYMKIKILASLIKNTIMCCGKSDINQLLSRVSNLSKLKFTSLN